MPAGQLEVVRVVELRAPSPGLIHSSFLQSIHSQCLHSLRISHAIARFAPTRDPLLSCNRPGSVGVSASTKPLGETPVNTMNSQASVNVDIQGIRQRLASLQQKPSEASSAAAATGSQSESGGAGAGANSTTSRTTDLKSRLNAIRAQTSSTSST